MQPFYQARFPGQEHIFVFVGDVFHSLSTLASMLERWHMYNTPTMYPNRNPQKKFILQLRNVLILPYVLRVCCHVDRTE